MTKISVCIPVFNSEKTLRKALDSVVLQDFPDWEIVLVNDGSKGKDEKGRNAKKIAKAFVKENRLARGRVRYLEHRTNLGLLEARRTAVEAALGEYIVILDSDDALCPGALKVFYDEAVKTGADIVRGRCRLVCIEDGSLIQDNPLICDYDPAVKILPSAGNRGVFDSFLVQKKQTGYLWAKMYKKSVYQRALLHIPFSRCVLAEDFLQYFFISLEAKSLVSLEDTVYDYSVGTGMSTGTTIDELSKWEQICTTANVFTVIFAVLEQEEIALSEEETEALKLVSRSYLADSLIGLEKKVSEEIKAPARAMLCEYWGEDFVEIMEKAVRLDRTAD